MSNFLTLFNRIKGDLRKERQKVSEGQQRYLVLEEKMKAMQAKADDRDRDSSNNHDGGVRRRKEQMDWLADREDGQDVEIFGKDEVEKLARGVRLDDGIAAGTGTGTIHGDIDADTGNGNGNSRSQSSANGMSGLHSKSNTMSMSRTKAMAKAKATTQGNIAGYVERRKRKVIETNDTNTKKRTSNAINGKSSQGKSMSIGAETGTEAAAEAGAAAKSSSVTMSSNSRTNPHTGAMEVWNVEDMFSDSSDGGAE